MTAKKNVPYQLIFDSCIDIPAHLIQADNVSLLNCRCTIDGEELVDDLFASMSAADFFGRMRSGQVAFTSQPAYKQIYDTFSEVLDRGLSGVCFCFSSKLSGTYNTVSTVAERLAQERGLKEGKDPYIYVVDTALASIAGGLVAMEAIQLRSAGLNAQEMVAWIDEAKYFVDGCFMLDNLEALSRGGRIPASLAHVSNMLNVKPMLRFDLQGALVPFGLARGRKKGIKQMVDYYLDHAEDPTCGHLIIIGGADCPKDVDHLAESLEKVNDKVWFIKSSIGMAIGSHVGPDMMAFTFWGKDRRLRLSAPDRIAMQVQEVLG